MRGRRTAAGTGFWAMILRAPMHQRVAVVSPSSVLESVLSSFDPLKNRSHATSSDRPLEPALGGGNSAGVLCEPLPPPRAGSNTTVLRWCTHVPWGLTERRWDRN